MKTMQSEISATRGLVLAKLREIHGSDLSESDLIAHARKSVEADKHKQRAKNTRSSERAEQARRWRYSLFPPDLQWKSSADILPMRDVSPDKDVGRWVRKYADSMPHNEGVLFLGPPGLGKTFYTAVIANEIIKRGGFVRFISVASFIDNARDALTGKPHNEDYPYTTGSLMRPFVKALILDDLGRESGNPDSADSRMTDYVDRTIFELVDHFTQSGRLLFATTNMTATRLKNYLSPAIYDRIKGACIARTVRGRSFRDAPEWE